MSIAWSRWLSHWFRSSRRPIRRIRNLRPRIENLESRITPTFFFGGVRVAAGEVNGDDVVDIITAAGPGGGAHVRVLSGISGTESLGIAAYDPSFMGGAFVAAGDTTGDGIDEIITGPGEGGGPHVRIFDGRTGQVVREFLAFDAAFTGGVRVAAGDVNNDGRADIICGAGSGGAPVIRVFNGATLQQIGEITAFDAGFRGGVFVGAGDINNDGRDDVIAGAGAGGAPHVLVFNGATSEIIKSIFAFDPSFRGGVTVAAGNFSSTARPDIFVGAGPGGAPQVRVFSSQTDAVLQEVLPFDAAFRGGVFVGSSRLTGSGLSEILMGAGAGGGAHVRALNGSTLAEVAGFCAYIPFTGPFGAFGQPSETPDTTAPTLTITTPQPTNPVSDNVTIQGNVTDNRPGTTVSAQVDGNPAQNVPVDANGNFTFTTNLPLNGQSDGSHTVTFVAQDAAGNQSAPRTFAFTLQTNSNQVTLDLAPENDGAVAGNHRTNDATVALIGTAPANSTVVLVGTNFSTTANAQGNYRFDGVALTLGVNSFTARATPAGGGGTVEFSRLIIRNSDPTVEGPIAPISVDAGAQATILNMPAIFSDLDINSLVRFNTGAGSFDLELFDQQTPITVQNLISYIQGGAYNNSIFHRSVANFVLQGGNFQFNTNPNRLDAITTSPAIQNEPGISNQVGTIAMAKLGGDPNSATSQFFFNLQDNSRGNPMLDTQNGGFTAFGQVRGDGMTIVNMLAAIPVQDRGGVFSEIPLQNYPQPPDGDFPTDTTSANYAFINSVEIVRRSDGRNGDGLVFSIVSNSNPNLVTATLSGARLTLDYAAGQSGRATITLRAVDLEGSVVETTFTINVGDVPDDSTAPTIAITDPPNGQTVASNVTVQGTVTDDVSGVFSLTASIDGGPPVPVTVGNGGAFSFTTALATDGTDDGLHTIVFVARDQAGNVTAPTSFTFTLDSGVQQLTMRLDAATDTAGGGIGDNNRTILDVVTLEGTTDSGSTVTLVGTAFTTTADASGNFSFTGVPLALGVNAFTVRATDLSGNSRELTRNIIRTSDPTVASAVQNFQVAQGAIPTFLNLPAIFSDIDISSLVRFTTPAGTFDLELFDQQTPQTIANFLAYIDDGRYANSIFHRSIANFVIQGGGFQFIPGPPGSLEEIETNPAVQNEPGISNQIGTIAMAKLGGDPNSATSQFFFNLADNSRGGPMLDTQNGGFTAFGQLRGNGLSVIQALAAIATQDRGGVFTDIPLQNFPQPPAGNFPGDTTAANYAFINSIDVVRRRDADNGDALTYSVVGNSNPSLVEATIAGGKLTLTYTPSAQGQSTITLRATDAEGRFVESSFVVSVGDQGTDTTAPTISITSPPSGQTVSTNINIVGEVTDDRSGVVTLTVSIDGADAVPVTVDNDGNFAFMTSFELDGSDDGPHTLSFVGTDLAGNMSAPTIFQMTLDTVAPLLDFRLSNASDTASGGVAGNNRTNLAVVVIEGTSEPNAGISIGDSAISIPADAQGKFQLSNFALAEGVNEVRLRATDQFGNVREETRIIVRNSNPTVAGAIANFAVAANAAPTIFNLPSIFSDRDVNSLLRFSTTTGTFDVELFDQFAPEAVQNFLTYVTSNRYHSSIFHSAVAGAYLQGGGYGFDARDLTERLFPIQTEPSIASTPTLSNLAGTLAMASLQNQPGSYASQFLFNLQNNVMGPFPFDTLNGGLTVFGQLRGNGLQSATSMAAFPTQDRGGDFNQIPMQNYPQPPAGNFPNDTTSANFAFLQSVAVVRHVNVLNGDSLAFSVVGNSNSALVTPTIVGGRLTLAYAAGQTGSAMIRLRAMDEEGRMVETQFTVTVG